MIDKIKLKSYALLMAYDLKKIIDRNTDHLKEYLKKESDPLNEKILLHLNEIGKTPIDIYTWSPDWDELCYALYLMVKPLLGISLIESNTMLLLLKKWRVESENIDLKTLSNRLVFIMNKYYYLKSFFLMINENYLDFIKYHKDIEIGSEKFNEIILKKINKGGVALTSERTNTEIRTHFSDAKKNKSATYEFILNNLPLDLLTEISNSNEKKVVLFFQKAIAREMLFYLNLTQMSITRKQYFLGFSFLSNELIDGQDEFIEKKRAKDKYYVFAFSDYEEFLRTKGYNVYKSL